MTTVRTATLADLEHILTWAAAEGWNPGQEDAAAFFAADPDGFFVALDDNGTDMGAPIAAISVVNHAETFAFLGHYIVQPSHRGQGIGLALWTEALKHAGTRVVGLDGVEDQQANYAASGFVLAGGTTRFTGQISGQLSPAIRHATKDDLRQLTGLEAAASGTAKPAYMNAWFTQVQTRQTLVFDRNGTLSGACTIRKCGDGAKIGPLLADTAEVAEALIHQAATLFTGPITIDVPETSTTLTDICQTLNMQPGFKTARMYRGTFAHRPPATYAVTTLELG